MIGLLALAVASTVQCPAENAHYVLRHMPDVTAYFRKVDSGDDWPSHLALAIHFEKSDRTFWWLPWLGGTDGLQNLASTTDVMERGWKPPNPDDGPRPYGNRQFIATDAAYNIFDDVPRQGKAAPFHLLAPNGGGARDESFPIKQFFDLVSCSSTTTK